MTERRWYFDWSNDWWPFLDDPKTYNWIDITLLHFGFEMSPYKRSREVSIALLGFTVTVTRTDKREEAADGR